MTGEAHDHKYPDSIPISDQHNDESARILESALIWLALYYLIVLPFNLMPINPSSVEEYDDGDMSSRFSYFKNFRQYENVHMMFWLAKDLAWNRSNIGLWVGCLVPTIFVATDLAVISYHCKVSLNNLIINYILSYIYLNA